MSDNKIEKTKKEWDDAIMNNDTIVFVRDNEYFLVNKNVLFIFNNNTRILEKLKGHSRKEKEISAM